MQFIEEAARVLTEAQSVLCLTGAGVSAESGIATFRDAQTGLWANFDPQTLASQAGFAADPGLVWRWYMERLSAVEQSQPNPGHYALAALAQRVERLTLVTQNIDDLHERAGSEGVLHIHGQITKFRCNRCRERVALSTQTRSHHEPPQCVVCQDRVRPDVVWFGENLPARVLDAAWRAAERCDVVLVVGTSGVVYPAAQLPFVAKQQGATLIDVNPDCTPISEVADLFLQGSSGEVLPQVLAAMGT